ncbi:MAG: choice-of-anchor B family protein [Flavobacteriales bacterium]|nr:choice-of-anchor B family protein [Flavobacteriales bacterium]
MKNFLLVTFCFTISLSAQLQIPCVDGMAGTYPCNLVDLMAKVPLDDIGGGDNTNDIWGWKSPNTGKEYALVGCNNGCAFVDVSDPTNPVYMGILPPHYVDGGSDDYSLWRDVEDYMNYAFVVSEKSGHGLQVFDLLQLDAVVNPPVVFDETTHYAGFGHCHTIDINEATGYAYCNGTYYYNGGLFIVDISDPLNPVIAGSFEDDGYTHDCHAVLYDGPDMDHSGKEIVMACNEDELTVVDCTDKSDCFAISINGYQGNGYCHQGWFTKDKKYFLVDDELDELDFDVNQRTHIFDVQDLDNVVHLGVYQSDLSSIDHNLYIEDQFVYESNYTSGVRILDAVHVEDEVLSEIAFFDVLPSNSIAQFQGTWSNYPFLPSGIILATDMYNGFFILQPRMIVADQESWEICGSDGINFLLDINAELAFPLTLSLEGLPPEVQVAGATITEPQEIAVTLTGLLALFSGSYDFNLLLVTDFGEQYEVPLHISVAADAAAQPTPITPANETDFLEADEIIFTWNEQTNATTYFFQLAGDNAFTNMIDEQTVTGTSYDPLFDIPVGTYYWRVQASNECGDSQFSPTFSFEIIFVGLDENDESSISIYPNPLESELNFSCGQPIGSIVMEDMAGRIVAEFIFAPSVSRTVDVSGIAAGVYTIKAGSTQRLIVKN